MKLTKQQAIERVYNICNLNDDDDDIIYKTIYKYKVLAELNQKEIDNIYNDIAQRMGWMKY